MEKNSPGEQSYKILVPGTRVYVPVWPDFEYMNLVVTGEDWIFPEGLAPFGFQKFLVYREHQYQGPFRRERSLDEARSQCFTSLISDLEKIACGRDYVLVDVVTNHEDDKGWLIQAYAQAMLDKKEK